MAPEKNTAYLRPICCTAGRALEAVLSFVCNVPSRLDQLKTLSEQLEKCQKSLSEYVDTKRCAFPRFYFISDDELLSILGTSDPTSVQEHMLKLFDNCAGMHALALGA